MPLRAVKRLEHLQAQRQRELSLLIQVHQRSHEVVPGIHKGEQSDHDQRRFGQRNDDPGENGPRACTIHICSFVHIFRYRGIKLPEQKDIKGRAKPYRQNQRDIRIDQVGKPPPDKRRNQGDGAGKHHAGQQQAEEEPSSRPFQPGVAVSSNRTAEECSKQTADRNDQCVAEKQEKVDGG